jgi:nucleoside-diphosphate-sugar epimerase
MVSIDAFVDMIAAIAGKRIGKRHIPGPTGVRGRNSDNRLIQQKLSWRPTQPLKNGVAKTYEWILRQTQRNASARAA